MKKIILTAIFALSACISSFSQPSPKKNVKVGFIYPGTIDGSSYTHSIDQARLSLEQNGYPIVFSENVQGQVKFEDTLYSMMKVGCNIIYATSHEYQDMVLKYAVKYPGIRFCVLNGDQRTLNVSTLCGKTYEGWYLAGIAAGLKTCSNRIGILAVGYNPSLLLDVNAFTLGCQSVNSEVQVEIAYTSLWDNYTEEKKYTDIFFKHGCDVILSFTDGVKIQKYIQENGKYYIGAYLSNKKEISKAYLTSVSAKWASIISADVEEVARGTWTSRDVFAGFFDNGVELDTLSPVCVKGTEKIVEDAKQKIVNQSLSIFSGPLYANDDSLIVSEGEDMSSRKIRQMKKYVKGVTVLSD